MLDTGTTWLRGTTTPGGTWPVRCLKTTGDLRSDSPASQVASKAFTYDTYMCPDPHEEYPLRHREPIIAP